MTILGDADVSLTPRMFACSGRSASADHHGADPGAVGIFEGKKSRGTPAAPTSDNSRQISLMLRAVVGHRG
jgi:hypothetical protein